MRTCGSCRRAIRWDESLATCWIDSERGSGYCQACPRCIARQEGTPVPPARTYAPGMVPRHPLRDADLPICGLCREALYESERTEGIRLESEDLDQGDGTKPGAYAACPRCRERYLAAVHRRWVDLGLVSEHSTPAELRGRTLL